MDSPERLKEQLGAAISGPGGAVESADRLCHACVELLGVDGASISFVGEGASRGTFGSSGELSRRLDEFQFTFGEGPCLDAVRIGSPVLAPDLEDPDERRWPAFAPAVLESGIRSICALPITIAFGQIGALDLFRFSFGSFSDDELSGGLWAAKLATLPLMDLMSGALAIDPTDHEGDGWSELESLERIEVYQATGMVIAQLGVGPTEALLRIRAHAFAHDQTASEVAWSIIERRLLLEADNEWRAPGSTI